LLAAETAYLLPYQGEFAMAIKPLNRNIKLRLICDTQFNFPAQGHAQALRNRRFPGGQLVPHVD
jgi:hypothetical protein